MSMGASFEQLEMTLEQRPELETEILFQMLQLDERLLHPLGLRVGVADDVAGLELGVAQDQLALLAGVGPGLVGLELGRDQGLLESIPQLSVAGDLLLEPLDAVLQVDVLLEEAFELVGHLVEEDVDLLVGIAAHGTLEFLTPDVERRDFHFSLPSHRALRP